LLSVESEGYGDSRPKPLAMVNLLLCTADHFATAVCRDCGEQSQCGAGIPSGHVKEESAFNTATQDWWHSISRSPNTTSRSNTRKVFDSSGPSIAHGVSDRTCVSWLADHAARTTFANLRPSMAETIHIVRKPPAAAGLIRPRRLPPCICQARPNGLSLHASSAEHSRREGFPLHQPYP